MANDHPPKTDPADASPEAQRASTGYREATLAAVIFGLVVGAVMNASITYAGLKIGFTIGGSTIAAVLGFGVLRGLLRRGSILETNIGQTVASSVNIPNSGIIFTIPVLLLLDPNLYKLHPGESLFWLLTLACVAGAVLGCAFIIPIRKQMIDIDRLRFPTGTAVAAILKSPGAGVKKTIVLLAGVLLAVLVYLPAALPSVKVKVSLDELDELVSAGTITLEEAEQTRQVAGYLATKELPQQVVERGRDVAALDEAGTLPENAADRLALTAFKVDAGEEPWSALSKKFWVTQRLPGYGDLGWRLSQPRPVDPNEPGDEQRYEEELRRVDRDGDGESDSVLGHETFDVGRLLGLPDQVLFVFAIAPFALGAGYITGRPGLLVLAGGVLAFWVLNPFVFSMGWTPDAVEVMGGPPGAEAVGQLEPGEENEVEQQDEPAASELPSVPDGTAEVADSKAGYRAFEASDVPGYGYEAFNRPLGIGMLLGGALMGMLAALPSIREALKSLAAGRKRGSRGATQELGLGVLTFAALTATIGLFVAADMMIGGNAGWLGGLNPHFKSLLVALIGAVWIWFGGIIIAQCTGMTDWSPISGMALLTVVLVMLLVGTQEVAAAVLIGAAMCVAISCAADMMQDLKTGHLVGARPIRQQVVELATTGIGPVITMFTILLIVAGNMETVGKPIGPGTPTSAPQAQALKAVIEGVQGGEVPYALYGCGAILGVMLGLGSFPGLGVMVGLSMYLPIEYVLTYGVGCLINMAVTAMKGRNWAEEWGVPFCAGLIVGEAVLSIVINAVVLCVG